MSDLSDQQKLGHEFSPYLHEIIRQRYGIEDIEKLIQWVQELPTERRYLTPVATAQDLALQDFDRPTIGIEVNALNPQELQTIYQKLLTRKGQLDALLEALKTRLGT